MMTQRISVLFSLSLATLLCGCINDDPAQPASQSTGSTSQSTSVPGSTALTTPDAGTSSPGDASQGQSSTPNGSTSSTSSSSSSSSEPGPDPALLTCAPGRNDQCLPGEKCGSYLSSLEKNQTDATRCTPVIGNAKVGEACVRDRDAGNDDCGPMLFCDAGCSACDGPGVCVPFCDPENKDSVKECADRGVEGGHCFGFNNGALPICKKTCDPIAQDCADKSQACHATLDSFLCNGFRPEPGSDGTYGQPCERVQSCAPGLTCRAAAEVAACKDKGDGRCCTEICDLKAAVSQCTRPGESCQPIFKEPVSGMDHVGVCTLDKP